MAIDLRIARMFQKILTGRLVSGGKALDLGSQDLMGGFAEYEEILNCQFSAEDRKLFEERRVSARLLYKKLGFGSYTAIDLDGAHGAIVQDMNLPTSEWGAELGCFDFVFNGGTSEHCFNQYALFSNMHDLCVTGGIMFHVIPVHGGMNHGYFNYHPLILSALAKANDYLILDAWAYDGSGTGRVGSWLECSNRYMKEMTLDIDDPTSAVMLCIAMEKRTDNAFQLPYQTYEHTDRSQWDQFSDGFRTLYIQRKIGSDFGDVAVFGCGDAAKAARAFLEKVGYRVVCYVCDMATGAVDGLPIVNRQVFSAEFFSVTKALVVGPRQNDDFITGLPSSLILINLNDINL